MSSGHDVSEYDLGVLGARSVARPRENSDPTLNGHLRYPNNLDKPLNDASADKLRKYRVDYNNTPQSVLSFMVTMTSTSGRLHHD